MGICKKFKGFSIVTLLILVGALTACNKNQPASDTGGDPASGNLAAVNPNPSGESYAPPAGAAENSPQYQDNSYDQQPAQVTEPPPALPMYEQPPCPDPDYAWIPGYWAYGLSGYYWVPGTWVLAPYVGALWTPPWWGFDNGAYLWHAGYWAPHIGYYGGIDYGFGYTGLGYFGAYWNHGHMFYNRAVTSVDTVVVHNVYNYRVPSGYHSRVSYNGGNGGINARPMPRELAVTTRERTRPVPAQIQHEREAAGNRAQFAAANQGKPATLAAPRPLSTSYRAPAAPPRAVTKTAQRPVAQAPVRQEQPNQHGPLQATRTPESRPAPQPIRPKPNPFPENRVAPRQNPPPGRQAAPMERPVQRPAPEARTEARPAPRPAPQAHPAEARPAPSPRPDQREEHRRH